MWGQISGSFNCKRKQDHTNEVVKIEEQSIKAVPSVELLSTEIDDKLSFNLHFSKICNSAVNQLNAMTRLRNFMTFNVKEALITVTLCQISITALWYGCFHLQNH